MYCNDLENTVCITNVFFIWLLLRSRDVNVIKVLSNNNFENDCFEVPSCDIQIKQEKLHKCRNLFSGPSGATDGKSTYVAVCFLYLPIDGTHNCAVASF